MPKQLINQYYNNLHRAIQFGKSTNQTEKINTYRFSYYKERVADYKEQVIDLLKRVCMVSVETVRIVGEMEKNRYRRKYNSTYKGHC